MLYWLNMAKLTESHVFVVTIEHFTGALNEIVGVFTDLEAAKALQRSYNDMTRITVVIYRAPFYSSPKKRQKPQKAE